jgi:acyl-homoserine lactone acylase PvdQ
MGQSGRPGSKHYADMMPLYLKGDLIRLPMSRNAVRNAAKKHHTIEPV